MAGKIKRTEATKEEIKWVADFLKAHKVDLMPIENWNLEDTYRALQPWDREDWKPLEEGKLRWILEHLKKKAFDDYTKKSRQFPPLEVWVMGFHTHNALGSITHVSSGDPYYFSQEECQKAIDEMKGWIGMGDRSQYRPVRFNFKKGD